MKRIIYLIAGIFVTLFTLSSCSSEEIEGLDQSGVPKISEMQISITVVDKAATFHMENEGVVPIWIISAIKTVAQNDCQIKYKNAGTYTVEVKAYNRNGVSDGSVMKEFVVE
jgi:hypothetical protein